MRGFLASCRVSVQAGQAPATLHKRDKKRMSRLNIAGSIATLLAVLAPLHAQNGANAPGDFMFERILPLTAVIAPTPPSLPDAVLAGIQAGAIEIHQRFIYNSAQRTLGCCSGRDSGRSHRNT